VTGIYEHLQADIALSDAEMAALNSAFPRPKQRRPLEML
jgi:hypothetical protein